MPMRPGSPTPPPVEAHELPTVHLRRDHGGAACTAEVASGRWVRVRAGAFVAAAEVPSDEHRGRRHLALAHAIAVATRSATAIALSHTTAALLWGLPEPPGHHATHLIQQTRPGAHHADDVVRHVTRLPADERAVVAGLPTTTLARTAVDCARLLPPHIALVVVDAALRAGVGRAELVTTAEAGPRPGRRRALDAIHWADDGAESAQESLTRGALLRLGLPAPTTQVCVPTSAGPTWSDLGWEEWRLLVEYDGVEKYTPGTAALLREKRREDLIRDEGWRVVRLVSRDLREPSALLRRIAPFLPTTAVTSLRPRPSLAAPRTS